MFHRNIKLPKSNSFFLFGARGTGKSTLLHKTFSKSRSLFIDLLDYENENLYRSNPQELEKEILAIKNKKEWVIIDEIQKIPKLLDIVHKLIEKYKIKFALTGSSARKLKRGQANLLAGRAFFYELFPLTYEELGSHFNLNNVLRWGSLPALYSLKNENDKKNFLRTYTQMYLKEEILVEQIVRKLDPFHAFLKIAAQMNGKIINFSKIAQDVGVDTKTVQTYFEILCDTHIGFLLKPFHRSLRKRQKQNPKFYFFDLGVSRSLSGLLDIPLKEGTYDYGNAFEHFIIIEIARKISYLQKDYDLSFITTSNNTEIDLIIERPGKKDILLEIKSTNKIKESDTNILNKFALEYPSYVSICLSNDPREKLYGKTKCFHWLNGLKNIF